MSSTIPLDLPLRCRVYGVRVNDEGAQDCCRPRARRSGSTSGIFALGVAGVALCCALPSLLAGGVLATAAGLGFGVWAAIIVAVAAVIALVFRRRHQHHRPSRAGAAEQRPFPVKVPE